MRPYNHHSTKTDKIIVDTIDGRGNNAKTVAAARARQIIFKKTKQKYSAQSILQRYYKLQREANPAPESTIDTQDVRQYIVDTLMTKENVTIEIQGKQITAVFK